MMNQAAYIGGKITANLDASMYHLSGTYTSCIHQHSYPSSYKIPREVLITRVQENGLNMWQRQWTDTGKGAVTKAFFPLVRNRLRGKIPIFPEFTVLVTGHGKLRSYLHRFGITDNPMCRAKKKNKLQAI